MSSGRPQQALSRERILDAAQAIVTDEGLDAVSMRRVAASLGAGAMSLYNHVPNKEALLSGLAERVLAQVQVPEGASRSELAGSWARSVRDTLVANRQMLPLVLSRPQRTTLVGIARPLVESLVETGMDVGDALDIASVLGRWVAGSLLFEGASSASKAAGASSAGGSPAAGSPAKRHADPAQLERAFELGLDALIRGLPGV